MKKKFSPIAFWAFSRPGVGINYRHTLYTPLGPRGIPRWNDDRSESIKGLYSNVLKFLKTQKDYSGYEK